MYLRRPLAPAVQYAADLQMTRNNYRTVAFWVRCAHISLETALIKPTRLANELCCHIENISFDAVRKLFISRHRSWVRTLFESLGGPNVRNTSNAPERRLRLWASKEGQAPRIFVFVHSASSVPSCNGQIWFVLSPKWYLKLWKFNFLKPTLTWVRRDKP